MVLQAFRRANVASLDSTSTLNDIKLAVEASGLGSAEEVLLYMLKHGEGTRLTKMLRHCRQMKNLEEREAATHAQLVELAETPTPTQLVGDKKVAELRAVVCGIVKSEGTTLEDSLERLIGLRRVFADLHVVLYSHDCSKDVRDLIQDFRRQHPGAVTFLEDTNLPPERSAGLPSDARLRIDALGRNRLLLEALTTHGDCDLLLMCDISEVLSRFHAGMIEDCLSAHPTGSWDMLTANTYAEYHDIASLRTNANAVWREPVLTDCWAPLRRPGARFTKDALLHYVGRHQQAIPPGSPPIPVHSAFGGLAIAKLALCRGCAYASRGGVSEHVAFCRDFGRGREGGAARRILVAPKLRVQAQRLALPLTL